MGEFFGKPLLKSKIIDPFLKYMHPRKKKTISGFTVQKSIQVMWLQPHQANKEIKSMNARRVSPQGLMEAVVGSASDVTSSPTGKCERFSWSLHCRASTHPYVTFCLYKSIC